MKKIDNDKIHPNNRVIKIRIEKCSKVNKLYTLNTYGSLCQLHFNVVVNQKRNTRMGKLWNKRIRGKATNQTKYKYYQLGQPKTKQNRLSSSFMEEDQRVKLDTKIQT